MSSRPAELKAKAHRILALEKRWAGAVARGLSPPPKPVSVWEVMMPVLLVFNYARSRGARDMMVKNIVFTKRLALQGALQMLEHHRSLKDIRQAFEDRTDELLGRVSSQLYSNAIREAQLHELQILLDHYLALLQAEGRQVQELARSAYGTLEKYNDFLKLLYSAEEEVNKAVVHTLKEPGAAERVNRMQAILWEVRAAWAKTVFGEKRS